MNKPPFVLGRRGFLAASGAMLLAGCASNETPGGIEAPDVRVGVLAVPDVAPLYVANREGLYQREGLRPKMVESQLTGDNRFDLEHGAEDIHFDSWVTIFLNMADGADWVLVGEAYQASSNTTALVASPKSKLTSVRDLKGARIAVNNPRGLGVMLINALLATVGLTPNDVRYVETPFDQVAGTVQRGGADAGWLIEPYLTQAQLETGAVPIADTATGPTADLPQSGYVCARSFAKRNPNTIRSFRTALRQAQVAAQDRAGIERELTGYLKVTSTVASLMKLGAYPSSLRAVRPQRVADLMLEQGMLSKKINVSDKIL